MDGGKGVGDRTFRRDIDDLDDRVTAVEEAEGGGGGEGHKIAVQTESGPIVDDLKILELGSAIVGEQGEDPGTVRIQPLVTLGVRGDSGSEAAQCGELELSGATVEQSQEELEQNRVKIEIGKALAVHQYEGGDISKAEGENIEFGSIEAVVPEGRVGKLEAHVSLEQDSDEIQVIEVAILQGGNEVALTNAVVPPNKPVIVDVTQLLVANEWVFDIIAINPSGSGFNLLSRSGSWGNAVTAFAAVTLL